MSNKVTRVEFTKPVMFYLTEDQYQMLRKLAYIQERKQSEVVREALDHYFKGHEKGVK